MRLGFKCIASFGLGALLLSCTSEPSGVNLDIFRSPSLFRADTTASDHPFCDQTNPVGTPAACKQEHKYKLTWLRPEDTANFQGYRIYFDTVPDDKKWADVQKHPELASVIVHRSPVNDSLVFVFTSDRKTLPDTLLPGQDRIVALDSNGRAELSTGKLVFALVPVYSGSGAQGQPQYAYFVTTDRQAPDVFRPDIRPLPHGLRIAWERPTDRVSFFDPGLDTGVIKGYRLELGLDGRITANRLNSFQPKLKSYRMGGSDSTAAVLDSLELKNGVPDKMLFKLPDGHRSAKHTHPDATDSMYVEIEGMFPQDTLTVQLWAIDSAGNSNDSAMSPVSIRTTDTTQPSTPKLGFDSLSLNGFTITWLAARDSVAGPGGLTEADHPNANIMDYRLTRTMVRAPGERTTSLDRMDTIVQDSLVPTRSQFRIPVRFLPPGATYHMTLFAEDSSGYPSQIDTMNVTTPKVAFADTDSVLTCPPGFIPMPRGKFQLGSNAFPGSDETPPRIAAMAPYCIEPYEHRDSTGQRFVSNVTYEQAEAICEAISPEFATKLCSEAEWERACEGPTADSALALRHGIQSETNDPSILQASCNQATNDSDMAFNFSLRNPICLTTEGVYDMAGNLSEWVRDTYFPNAYNSLSGDTLRLDHGTVFADSGERPPHSLRGGNYLKPDRLQLSAVQNLARCSNRDFPEQVRPVYRDSCLSEDKPRLVVIFGTGLDGHRCFTPKDVFLDPDVTDLRPAPRIDTAILAFHRGSTKVDTQRFSPDSTFRGKKPTSAKLTTKTLAVVKFERILPISAQDSVYDDTLDATEFLDTTQAGLAKIFQREASNSEWTVHKEDGKFAIKYLYAYTQLGSKPALPYYSNRAIGFRCCSLAAKKVVPTDSVAGPSAMSAALHR